MKLTKEWSLILLNTAKEEWNAYILAEFIKDFELDFLKNLVNILGKEEIEHCLIEQLIEKIDKWSETPYLVFSLSELENTKEEFLERLNKYLDTIHEFYEKENSVWKIKTNKKKGSLNLGRNQFEKSLIKGYKKFIKKAIMQIKN